MNAQDIQNLLVEEFGEAITGANLESIDPWIEVAADSIVEVCAFLRDDERLQQSFARQRRSCSWRRRSSSSATERRTAGCKGQEWSQMPHECVNV